MTVIERYQPLLGIDPAKIKQKSPQDKTRALWPQLEAREDRPLPFILPIKISWGSYPSGGIWGRHYFVNKGPSSQGYGFSSGHVWIWELDCEESWAPKNWCFWTAVLEKSLERPLDYKEIQPFHSKDQSWVFIGRTDAEAETPILWSPDAKSWLIWKDPDAEKDWRQEEKGTSKDKMVGWHHRLNGHGFGRTPGVGDGQGGQEKYQ